MKSDRRRCLLSDLGIQSLKDKNLSFRNDPAFILNTTRIDLPVSVEERRSRFPNLGKALGYQNLAALALSRRMTGS